MGKPGNTTKLKKKIFCKFGIIPRQSRVPAGTEFFQVNKNVQLVKHHRISEQENFQINNPLVTNSFQWHLSGESFVLYPWNDNLSRKASISTCYRGISTQKNRLSDGHSKNCVNLILPNRFPTCWSSRKCFIPWRHHLHNHGFQSPWIIVILTTENRYISNSIDQLSILVSEAQFPSRNIAKKFALVTNTSTTSSIRFGNESLEVSPKQGKFTNPTMGQLHEFSRKPVSISEATKYLTISSEVLSIWASKHLGIGLLVLEYWYFFLAEALVWQYHGHGPLRAEFSDFPASNQLIQFRPTYVGLEQNFLMLDTNESRQSSIQSLIGDNSNDPTMGQLRYFSRKPTSITETINSLEVSIEVLSKWRTKRWGCGHLFQGNLQYLPAVVMVRQATLQGQSRAALLAIFTASNHRIQLQWVYDVPEHFLLLSDISAHRQSSEKLANTDNSNDAAEGQFYKFLRKPASISEATNFSEFLTEVVSRWGTKHSGYGSLVRVYWQFHPEKAMVWQALFQGQLTCEVSSKLLLPNPLMQSS